jgi:hypothetical protein
VTIREVLLVHPIFHRGSGNTKKFINGKEGITLDLSVNGGWVHYDGKHGGKATAYGIPAGNIAALVCEPVEATTEEPKRGPGRPPKAPPA